jgi:rhamnosyltransferase
MHKLDFDIDKNKSVVVVIVSYFPNEKSLFTLINNVKSNAVSVILIDNTTEKKRIDINSKFSIDNGVIYLPQYNNIGIAAAQNIGVNYVLNKTSSTYIVFLDQDTQVPNNYLDSIFKEYNRALDLKLDISVLAPVLFNNISKKQYKINNIHSNYNFIRTDKVSSSGSLISVNTFKIVGLFDEELFIDYVDSEWCWRASSYNLNCFITNNVKISHSIGNGVFRIFGLNFIISNNHRYYYQYRNWLLLLKRSYVPFQWKIKVSIKNFIFLFIIPFKFCNYIEIYRFIYNGIFDFKKNTNKK